MSTASEGATGVPAPAAEGSTGVPAQARKDEEISQKSLGELISEVTNDLSRLMRQELDLAKAEVKEEAVKTGRAAGMLGGATIASYLVVLFLSFAAWWGLANVMDEGWAALIVAGVWAVIAAVLFVVGRRRIREVRPKPERTVDTLKEIPDALKGREEAMR